jgi:hypothetical protein
VSPVTPRGLTRVFTLAVLMTVPRAVEAGPLLICHPFDAGAVSLLPWGSNRQGWNTPDRSYDVQRLTGDTMRLLSADAPVLARMENLRRATIYASRDRLVAAELLSAVLWRALSAAAEGRQDPLAWFDAGYLIESYRQADQAFRGEGWFSVERVASLPRGLEGPDGYPLVLKALELAGTSPEMDFAASLMTKGPVSAEHRRRATSGAQVGSPLAKNLSR